ncbi:MAG: hypothetical protein KBB29_07145 [Bacteroidales bacterium]|jgi:hypothetical protein|nr:hypothetical protein [Bacteroidales bacterium]HOA10706.1 hypothetical protein [Tenuifilaceae bacterium]HOG73271.1 hypothetical protein [Tenuifilaceae bacterium]
MVKSIVQIFFLMGMALVGISQECTTMWPYIYPEFKEGTLLMVDGSKLTAQFNVHVQEGRLHYLVKGIIKEARSGDILLANIGDDIYMNVDGSVMKVVGSEERGFVATLILADFDKLLNSTQGAYGASLNSSAKMKLSSIEVGGKTIVDHMLLKQRKEEGETLPLMYEYFIVTRGKVFPATKKSIMSQLDDKESAEFKKFLKVNKIKWNDPQSLLKLLEFFNR